MTINTAIALANIAFASGYLLTGVWLLWQARPIFRQWPVSMLLALSGPFFAAALVLLHWMLWRFVEVPGEAFDETGLGTLFLRLAGTVIVYAWLQRVVRGRVLNASDRERVHMTSPIEARDT
jgi:hypothetical protein